MKKKCLVCGYRFRPTKEKVYTVYEPKSVIEALSSTEKCFDVIDCPRCGCQNELALHLPSVENTKSEVDDNE